MNKLQAFFKDTLLIKRIAFLVAGLAVFRVVSSIPLPLADKETLAQILSQNQLLGIFNLFSGGALHNFSIAMLGVVPFITVSIVLQLLTSVIPKLNSMYNEEGEIGRKKMAQLTRLLALPVCALNATGILFYFKSQGVFPNIDIFHFVVFSYFGCRWIRTCDVDW